MWYYINYWLVYIFIDHKVHNWVIINVKIINNNTFVSSISFNFCFKIYLTNFYISLLINLTMSINHQERYMEKLHFWIQIIKVPISWGPLVWLSTKMVPLCNTRRTLTDASARVCSMMIELLFLLSFIHEFIYIEVLVLPFLGRFLRTTCFCLMDHFFIVSTYFPIISTYLDDKETFILIFSFSERIF